MYQLETHIFRECDSVRSKVLGLGDRFNRFSGFFGFLKFCRIEPNENSVRFGSVIGLYGSVTKIYKLPNLNRNGF